MLRQTWWRRLEQLSSYFQSYNWLLGGSRDCRYLSLYHRVLCYKSILLVVWLRMMTDLVLSRTCKIFDGPSVCTSILKRMGRKEEVHHVPSEISCDMTTLHVILIISRMKQRQRQTQNRGDHLPELCHSKQRCRFK